MGGKVFTVEMHHSRVDFANPGDNVGLNIKGLDKNNMPRSGDVMVYKKDTTLGQTKEMPKSRFSTSPMKLKLGIPPLVLCDVDVQHAASQRWCGKWARRRGGKKWKSRIH